jgi:hypothetical protein
MDGNEDGQRLLDAAEPLRTVGDSPCVRHLLARIDALDLPQGVATRFPQSKEVEARALCMEAVWLSSRGPRHADARRLRDQDPTWVMATCGGFGHPRGA